MAVTQAPLVWDFYRESGNDPNVLTGGVAHFYDQNAQAIFVNGGLKTRYSQPINGQWETAALSYPSSQINASAYTRLNLDHPANGTLYVAATEGGNLVFMRYQYAADISDIIDSVNYTAQVDNQITQINANVLNVDKDFFTSEGSLFQPGAKITLACRLGDSEPYPIGVAYVDEISYDPKSKTVPISGRNGIGFFLRDSIFGDTPTAFTGAYPDIINWIMGLSGAPKWQVESGAGEITYSKIEPTDTLLDTLNWVNGIVYHSTTDPMMLVEFADGTIYSGNQSTIAEKMPNGYYTFDEGADVFTRKTKQSLDGGYNAIYATGKDSAGAELTPVVVPIDNYQFWRLPAKKILKLQAPEGWVATQGDLQWWAQNEANKRKYIGITEDFDSPFRPQLLVGDVAEVNRDGVGVTLGIITTVKHTMGKSGFKTSFSCDSGGNIVTTADGVRVEVTGECGYNRKQNMVDIVRKAAKI